MSFNAVTVSAALEWLDSLDVNDALSVARVVASVATETFHRGKQLITTSVVAINLGGISAPAWCIFVNKDTTNYIELLTSTSGTVFGKLLAGEPAMLRLGSGAQAPAAQANTASCYLHYLICSL